MYLLLNGNTVLRLITPMSYVQNLLFLSILSMKILIFWRSTFDYKKSKWLVSKYQCCSSYVAHDVGYLRLRRKMFF